MILALQAPRVSRGLGWLPQLGDPWHSKCSRLRTSATQEARDKPAKTGACFMGQLSTRSLLSYDTARSQRVAVGPSLGTRLSVVQPQ